MITSSFYVKSDNATIQYVQVNTIESEKSPLIRKNYLSEFKTPLEKAKVRKNLGIPDESTLIWGNIKGILQNQEDLVQEFNSKVDKEDGKSLILNSEIERLSSLENYDDTQIKKDISALNTSKADITDLVGKKLKGGEIFNDYVNNIAEESYSHAEGFNTKANGVASHAEGYKTIANGIYSHAEGANTQAGAHGHAEGNGSIAGDTCHAEGKNTISNGNFSHSEGEGTEATGDNSHSEGYRTKATGRQAHSEGNSTVASGHYSHAEGKSTVASGEFTHTEGYLTTATGKYSHSEGHSCSALGLSSHAEGESNTASGDHSHAEGLYTEVVKFCGHVEGKYNKVTDSIHILGGGASDTDRKNLHEIKDDGSQYMIGIGGYNGKNRDNAKSLQEVINVDLKESISDVSDLVTQNKNTIDNYTINGHKISSNPSLSKTDIGLSNVTNEAQIPLSQKGAQNGVATLDSTGKIPSTQLPSYVDDVLEYDNYDSFPETGESGKIYIDKQENQEYRWGGSKYVVISKSIALGETSSTAYAGDKGKQLADKIQEVYSSKSVINSLSDITIDSDDIEGQTLSAPNALVTWNGQKEQNDIKIPYATAQKAGVMSKDDKGKLDKILTNGTGTKYLTDNGTYASLNKSSVGLNNVDNTSDLDKPISTAVQKALDNTLSASQEESDATKLFKGNGELTEIKTINNQSLLGSGNINSSTTLKAEEIIDMSKTTATQAQEIANALGENQFKLYICSDSSGNLKGGSVVCESTLGKLIHPTDDALAVNLGDFFVIGKFGSTNVYHIIPVNDAKAKTSSFPGTYGLMVPNDKQKLDKCVDDIDKTCFRCYNGEYNANNCFWYGYYMYVNFGRPAGSEDGENYLLRVADIGKDSNGKYVIEQTLFSNKYATKIFRRIIKVIDKRGVADPSNVEYTDWERIGSSDIQIFNSVEDFNSWADSLYNLSSPTQTFVFNYAIHYANKTTSGILIHTQFECATQMNIKLPVGNTSGDENTNKIISEGLIFIRTYHMPYGPWGNWKTYGGTSVEVVQELGNSTTKVMSQKAVTDGLGKKQETLTSGKTIKTINGQSLLGSGDIKISGGGSNNIKFIDISTLVFAQQSEEIEAVLGKYNDFREFAKNNLLYATQFQGYNQPIIVTDTGSSFELSLTYTDNYNTMTTKLKFGGSSSSNTWTNEGLGVVIAGAKSIENQTGVQTGRIEVGRYYKFGEVSQLNITLIEDAYSEMVMQEYMFEFTSGSTPTVLTLPETVKWIGSNTIEANKTYQVSIVNNLAVMGGA